MSSVSYANDDNTKLYNEVVNFYKQQPFTTNQESSETSDAAMVADQQKKQTASPKNHSRQKTIKALRRRRQAESEIARLKKLRDEELRKQREEKERKVKEAKVKELLKALGYQDLADEMKVSVDVRPPL